MARILSVVGLIGAVTGVLRPRRRRIEADRAAGDLDVIETSELDDGGAGAAPAASGNGASVVHAYAPTLPATDPLAVARVRGEIGDELYASLFEMLLTEAASGLAEMRSALAGATPATRRAGTPAEGRRGGARGHRDGRDRARSRT